VGAPTWPPWQNGRSRWASGPLRIQTATRGEWEEFESGFALEGEEWLLANPALMASG